MTPLIILFLTGVIYWLYQRYRKLTVLKRCGIPGPCPHFIYGNFHQLRGRNVLQINEWIDRYGKIYGYYDGPVPTIVVSDLELLKKIQIKDFKLFAARKGLVKGGSGADETSTKAVGGYGISVQRWKEQRSMLTTTFTSQKMKLSVPLINGAIDSFIEMLEEKLHSKTPNAKTPNAKTPNAETPNAETPNAETPNAEIPTLKVPNPKEQDSVSKKSEAEKSAVEESGNSQSVEVDLYEMWQGLTMDTIGRSAFGVLTDVQRNPGDPFLSLLKNLFEDNFSKWVNVLMLGNIFFPEFVCIIYPIRFLQMKIASWLGYSNAHALRRMVARVIEKRRKDISWRREDLLQLMMDVNLSKDQMAGMGMDQLTASAHDHHQSNVQSVKNSSKGDQNGAMKSNETKNCNVSKVASGHRFSDEEIIANSTFFFAAGYETTSTLLGFMSHLLVNHADAQEKIREEVRELYDKDGRIDYNCVNNLPYLEAVMNESLRLFPPITTFVTRVSLTDYKYSDTRGIHIVIPKGANILVPVDRLHRDPQLWPEPDTFRPDRFLGVKRTFDTISFQPFGAGSFSNLIP